jgi:hypothetical protein
MANRTERFELWGKVSWGITGHTFGLLDSLFDNATYCHNINESEKIPKLGECSFRALQRVFHLVVSSGYALVMTSDAMPDTYYYLPKPWCIANLTHHAEACWNGGDNPDVPYFSALFDAIHTDTLVSPTHWYHIPRHTDSGVSGSLGFEDLYRTRQNPAIDAGCGVVTGAERHRAAGPGPAGRRRVLSWCSGLSPHASNWLRP